MTLREDILEEEIKCINASERCEGCSHLTIFHQMGDAGYGSYCEIDECMCEYDTWESKWIKEEIE
jgi:hypothetical protein